MTKFDKDYLELVNKVLDEGIKIKDNNGIEKRQIFNYSFNFDLSKEFPILQMNQVFYKDAIIEMLWIWQMESNDVRELQKRGINTYDHYMIDKDGIYRIYDDKNTYEYNPKKEVEVEDVYSLDIGDYYKGFKPKLDDMGKVMMALSNIDGKNIKAAKYYGKSYANTIGTALGYINKKYELIRNTEYTLKNIPNIKKIVNNLYQYNYLNTGVVEPNIYSLEWHVTLNELNLFVHQSGCDIVNDLPNNMVQYATLLMMMAHVTGLKPGMLTYSINDAYVDISNIDGLKEQVKRWNKYCYFKEMNTYELLNKSAYIDNLMMLSKEGKATIELDKLKDLDLEYKMLDMILNAKTCELWLNPLIDGFFDFDNSRELKDMELRKYKHLGKVKGLSLDRNGPGKN